jgi:hypothetical protein
MHDKLLRRLCQNNNSYDVAYIQKHLTLCADWLQHRSRRSWLNKAAMFIFCRARMAVDIFHRLSGVCSRYNRRQTINRTTLPHVLMNYVNDFVQSELMTVYYLTMICSKYNK